MNTLEFLEQWFRNAGVFLSQTYSAPEAVIYTIGVLFLLYWTLSVLRTIKDISSRTQNFFAQALAVLLVALFSPLVGLPLYLLLRPVRRYWDSLEWREAIIAQSPLCPSCHTSNPLHHAYCSCCSFKLQVECENCKGLYNWTYNNCVHCGSENKEDI